MMKKTLPTVIIALVVIFGLVMAGCDQPTDNNTTKTITTPIDPVVSDFTITGLSATADGQPKAVSVVPKPGKAVGEVTAIWYTGTSGTDYPKSQTPPTGTGRYAVTFDVAAAEGFNAKTGLNAGTLVIARNPVVGTLSGGPLVHEYEIKAANTRYVEDTALIHLINDAMLHYTQEYNVTLTGTAPLASDSNALEGPILFANMGEIYYYTNTLYVVEMTGAQFKEWMEWAHWDYHRTNMKPGDLTVPYGGGIGYNFDQFDGLTYKVDISKDRGQRIVQMKNPDGTDFDLTKTYRVAINNHRQSYLASTVGVSGTVPVVAADVGGTDMQGLIADYIEKVKGGAITNVFTPSWEFIIPGSDQPWYATYRAKAVELLNDGTFTFSATTPINVADVKLYMDAGAPALPAEFDSIVPTQGPAYGPLTVDFEDAAWDGGAYAARAVKYDGFEWMISGVIGNTDNNDRKTGDRSVRFRGGSSSTTQDNGANTNRIELMTYLANGIKSISFDYGSYGGHSGGTLIVSWQKQGGSWVEADRIENIPSWTEAGEEMLNANIDINQTGKVRFKIEKLYVGSGSISANVDNIEVICME